MGSADTTEDHGRNAEDQDGNAAERGRSTEVRDRLVLRPGDPGYDEELAGFQSGFAQRPAVIFAASSADDVAAAVRYAASAGLPVGVRATGHGLSGAAEGGVLITTRRMDEVSVDPEARTVRVQAGVRWGQVVTAAEPYGLAP